MENDVITVFLEPFKGGSAEIAATETHRDGSTSKRAFANESDVNEWYPYLKIVRLVGPALVSVSAK